MMLCWTLDQYYKERIESKFTSFAGGSNVDCEHVS